MHKVFWLVAAMGVVVGVSAVPAEPGGFAGAAAPGGAATPGGFAGISAPEMTAGEMDKTEGALFARGARKPMRTRPYSWTRTPSRRDRVHCDIIARNRAESMGFDTSSPSGAFRNYNNITVSQIFSAHRGNRYSTPPRGTAGYIFTGGSSRKTHLQFYDNRSGGSHYNRYTNRSYSHRQSTLRVRPGFVPDNVSQQSFVPLPRRDHRTVWSW